MDTKDTEQIRPSLWDLLRRLWHQVYQATLAKPLTREILIGVTVFFVLVAIMQLGLMPQQVNAVVGQPISRTVLAPRDMEDPFETERQRREAAQRAFREAENDRANWYIAPEIGAYAEDRLNRFFEDLDQARSSLAAGGSRTTILGRLRDRWSNITSEAWQGAFAAGPEKYAALKDELRRILVAIEENERISNDDLRAFRESLPQIVARYDGDPGDPVQIGILRGLIVPNLLFDQERANKLVEQAKLNVPVKIYRSGQPLLEQGELVTEEKYDLLKSAGLVAGGGNFTLSFLSMVLFVLVIIAMALGYLYRFNREILRQERLLYLIALTMALAALGGKICALDPAYIWAYFAPVTFASILWVLLLDPQVAMMLTVLLSLLMGVVSGFQLGLTIYTLIGGGVVTFVLYHRRQRADLMKSGFFLSAANVFSVLLLSLLGGIPPTVLRLVAAVSNGLVAAVLAIGLLPFLENLFGLTSGIRLLELANPNQPLLRQMLIEAPGTYHHSIMVGNLAEAAADRIGADALLVRLGAYYHDIGKIKRPYFFVENQIAQDNPHEKLTPTLSTLIITAHVKEGVELARQIGLPEAVVDIIEQHHGTDLVRYFYARAAENTQAELAENDFRYDGPRPRTKEAALVMLADSVEAAVRAMVKPTPAKIEALTEKIIKERLDDGQFDECDLTFRDLELIKSAFIKVLGGIFHTRIEYPESVLREFERKKGTNGDLRKQPAG